jgi:ABC-2 type transport system ATP-binding protein
MMATAVFELDQIVKNYPAGWFGGEPRRALRGVSLRVEPGEVFGLVGPNRAGKTTLIKILLSLCRPTSGTGTRFGRPFADRSTLARIGYVHEAHAFPGYLTASAALQFYGALTLMNENQVRERVPRLLELVGLADRGGEQIRRFSKGMRQRLAVAQALVNEPALLVLDEPIEGLDFEGRAVLRNVVSERRRKGGAVLLVSHALTEVELLCDRVGVLHDGHLVRCGPLSEFPPAVAGKDSRIEIVLSNLHETCVS